jgi:metal-responsive CopG/Arc/MetJ family transcriptional regulator
MAGISISLPAELNYNLERIAYDEHRSKSEVVQDAIRIYVLKKQKEEERAQKKGA